MTAREFLSNADIEVNTRNLYLLTRYLDSEIDFSQFPDASVGNAAEDVDEIVNFQEYIYRQK